MREKGFDKSKQLMMSNFSLKPKSCNLYIIKSTFVSPIYALFGGKNNCLHTNSDTNREKNFKKNIYKGKMQSLPGNKHLSVHFFVHIPRLVHISTENCTGIIRQKWKSN